jgi:quercetin dioxygenase-like cupin family protein
MTARAGGATIGAMNLPTIKIAVPVAGWATQGQYALVEACVEAGTEIPSHVAQREDVVLHVLHGTLDVVVDRTHTRLTTGGSVSLERGTPRRITATEPSRVLALIAPAGLEQLLSVVADPTTDPDDRAALLAVGGVQTVPSA